MRIESKSVTVECMDDDLLGSKCLDCMIEFYCFFLRDPVWIFSIGFISYALSYDKSNPEMNECIIKPFRDGASHLKAQK